MVVPEALTSKTVLITGAGGGIGRATVKLFSQYGWRVIGVDRNPFGESFPEKGLYIEADISIGENLEGIFKRARAFTDCLHALVNNAAVQISKPMLETSVEEWDAVMASNLRSVFLGVKLAHPLMKNAGGGRDCECFFSTCHCNFGQHCCLCCQQGRLTGADARYGN